MKLLLTEGMKIVVCSGVLWAAYELLLERRVPLHWCRRCLLLLPLLACTIPQLRIPVLPAPVIELTAVEPLPLAEPAPVPAAASALPLAGTAVLALWLAGTLVMAGAMLRQIAAIRRLRRGAAFTFADGFRLALLPQRIMPFSFQDTVYLWEGTPAEERRAVVAHESSHIAHRHSAERIAMECMKALLWWNPFVWAASLRLTEAQEYEADRDVLTGGYDRELYMETIFRQLFGHSPDIAQGLHDSLTKKRFQMMTIHHGGRYVLLRLAGAMLAVMGLLGAFSLTSRAAEVRILPAAEQQPSDAAAPAGRPEPLCIVNGKELQTSLDEAFERTLGSVDKGTQVRLRKLSAEEGMKKYGEKGRNGVVEITVSALDEASAAAVEGGEADGSDAAEAISPVSDAVADSDPDTPWLIVETMPKFRGGDLQKFRVWVQSQIRYPEDVLECGISGRVVVTFIVERDGSMSSLKVLQTPDRLLTNEVLRVLESVPAGSWTPGVQDGEPVRVRYTLPVEFKTTASETREPAESE
ncbi:MAG: M56 family metallopeptidase [Alistipes sp.]|nr:M56 family metallopeptidase [Alistipes sp.]